MSTGSVILAILLHLAVLVPIALASRPGRVGDAALALCPLLALAVVTWQFGLFGAPRPQVTLGIQDEAGRSEEACKEVTARLKEGRLLLDDSDPRRVVVAGATWRQLPDSVRTAITDCFAKLAPGEEPVEIVEQPAR